MSETMNSFKVQTITKKMYNKTYVVIMLKSTIT